MPTFTTPHPITAALTTAGAQIHLTATDRPDTTVHIAPLNKAGEKIAENTTIAYAAGELTIKTKKPGARTGSIAHLDHIATLQAQIAATDLHIAHAHADIDLTGSSGTVTITRADAGVTAKAAACPLRITYLTHGPADLSNASGGIEIGLPKDAPASVDADSTKGTVHNTAPTAPGTPITIRARTRKDDIVIHPATA